MADLQINASLHNSRTVQRFVQSGNEAKAVLQSPSEKPKIGESTSVQMSTTNPIAKRPSIVKEETNPMMGGGGGSHRLPSRRLSVREQILEEKISAQGRRPSATGGSSADGTQIVSGDAATSAYAEELRRQLAQERSMIDNMKVQVRHDRQSAAVIIQFTAVCPFGAFSYIIVITVVDDKCCYLLLSYMYIITNVFL
jgi:hypothetical protein